MRKAGRERIKESGSYGDAPKPGGPYTQIPCYDTPKSESPIDNLSTRGIFMVAFLYIFLTNIQILIIF